MKNLIRKSLLILLILALGTISTSLQVSAKKNRYVAMEKVSTKNSDLDLFINDKTLTLDLLKTNNIRVRIKAKELYNSIDRTASFKISTYEVNGSSRTFISSQQLSIFKGFRKSRVVSISAGEFTTSSKILEFDIYDTAGNLINTYRSTINAINVDSQVSGSTGVNIAEANCDGSTFGECQIDYLLQRIQFEARPQRQASTRVIKSSDGLYKVTFPFPRSKFKFLGRKVRRKASDDFGTGTGNGGAAADFGETLNISVINIGDSLAESQFITYGANGELIFNDNVFLDITGKLGIGVNPPEAWLHIRNGDGTAPSMIINPGPLTTTALDGAIEYDGTDLYFTAGGIRNILGSGSGGTGSGTGNNINQTFNNGAITYNDSILNFNQSTLNFYDSIANYYNHNAYYDNGNIAYDNGTVLSFSNGSYLENPILNGSVLLTDNSTLTINGQLFIPGGTGYQVLTYVNGEALWRDTSAVANGGTTVNNNVTHLYNNGDITYNDTTLVHNNGDITYNDTYVVYNNGDLIFNESSLTFNQTTLDYTEVTENFYDSIANYFNQTDLYDNSQITYDNGTIISFSNGSYLENPVLNGSVLLTDNSTLTINGQIFIPGGANNQVLTYVNGEAIWQNATGGTTNGSSTTYTNVTNIYNNGDVTYNDTTLVHNNGDITYNESVLNFNQTTLVFNDSSANYFNQTDLYDNSQITYDNGTILSFSNGSMLQDPTLNGNVFLTDNSVLTINGQLLIPGNATNGYVLTSDANGVATWQEPNGHWTDIGTALHPTDLSGAETIIIGGTSLGAADIQLNANGGAEFNKQTNNEDFIVNSSTGQAIKLNGTNGNLSVGPTEGNAKLNVDGNFAMIGTSTQSITAGTGIVADRSYVRIVGNGGAVTISANPQISVTGTIQDGQILILKGTDNTNTVTVIEGNGVSLDSGLNFTIGDKDILQLIYDSTDGEWIELMRSDK